MLLYVYAIYEICIVHVGVIYIKYIMLYTNRIFLEHLCGVAVFQCVPGIQLPRVSTCPAVHISDLGTYLAFPCLCR